MSDIKGIHDGHRKRMIEKVMNSVESMPEHELLEVLLFGAIPRKNTNDIAHLLISRFGSIENVLYAEPSALEAVDGIGKTTAGHLVLMGQLIKRISTRESKTIYLRNLAEVKEYLSKKFFNLTEEKFFLLLLNSRYKLITATEFDDKKLDKVTVPVSDLAKTVILNKPKFAIIAHNHISGVAKPSTEDDFATAKVNILCDLHATSLIEHIIYTKTEVYSYNNDGRLQFIKTNANFFEMLNNFKEK